MSQRNRSQRSNRTNRRRSGLRIAGAAGLLGALLFAHTPSPAASHLGNTPILTHLTPHKLLVIVPHPDDETLAATGLIERTLSAGGQVKVAVMTNGDGFQRAAALAFQVDKPTPQDLYRLGRLRQQEELEAVGHLGLSREDIVFLGYPDAGLHRLWSEHWNDKRPYRSLNGHQQVPYPLSYRKDAPYCGQAVVADLRALLATFQPTDVLYPDPLDIHNDHWATSAFAQYALTRENALGSPREWTYLIHYPDYPAPRRYNPLQALEQPASLGNIGHHWYYVPLPQAAQAKKHRALLAHRSQIKVMRDLLESFVRQNDLIAQPALEYVPQNPLPSDPFSDASKKGVRAVADPLGDQRERTGAESDIRSVQVRQAGAQVQVILELGAPLTPARRYAFRFRMPGTNEADLSRLDLHWHDGTLTCQQQPQAVIPFPEAVRAQAKDNRLLVSLPRELLGHVWMLSADVSDGHVTLDQSPWRRFRLPF
ncbi:MAG TPA: PIG-L family deacetylase [Bacilli bacterium]|nr:PIG-L family deacetylase [Bacilli bacterium]